MWKNQEQEYEGQDDYAYNQQAGNAGYQGGYPQDSPSRQSGKGDEGYGKDRFKVQKDQDRNFYLQQFKQQEFQEDQRRRDELDKKARAKQEMAESYQRQIQEKKEREQQAKLQDAHFSRSTAENSSFANQDRQREQFLTKLKTGPGSESQQPQYQYQNRNTQKTDIFNRDLSERTPVQKQPFSDPNLDKLDQKKRMEREIFLENQKIAVQKKVDVGSQKSEQRFQDRDRAQNDYAEYERQQAVNRYSQAVQQKENFKALDDQIKSKVVTVDDRKYQQDQYSAHDDFLAGDSKLGYLKNKQRAGGAGYNILTGM
jgi:hypothetical protein